MWVIFINLQFTSHCYLLCNRICENWSDGFSGSHVSHVTEVHWAGYCFWLPQFSSRNDKRHFNRILQKRSVFLTSEVSFRVHCIHNHVRWTFRLYTNICKFTCSCVVSVLQDAGHNLGSDILHCKRSIKISLCFRFNFMIRKRCLRICTHTLCACDSCWVLKENLRFPRFILLLFVNNSGNVILSSSARKKAQ